MVYSDCTVSTPIKLLFIRCGWSVKVFKERYFKYEAGGNQHVDCCAFSIDQKPKCFLCSPHLFGFNSLENLQSEHIKSQLDI